MEEIYEMSNPSNTWPKNCVGIYGIYSKSTNKIYVGKTNHKKGFSGRWNDHRDLLRANKHDNIYLQNSYNKNGENDFYFKKIEICLRNDENLELKEWQWIDKLQSMFNQKGWNIDTHEKYEKRKFSYRPTKRKLLKYEFIDPNGNIVKGENLEQFANSIGVYPENLNKVLHGKMYSYKGYRSTNQKFHRKYKEYKLIGPDGIEYSFNNITKFSKEHGLNFSNVSSVLLKKTPHTKGWHLENPPKEFIENIDNFYSKKYLYSHKDNVIFEIKSVRSFCLKYFLKENSQIYKIFSGERESLQGLIIPTKSQLENCEIVKTY